ncbi:PREDICTED: interleukin-4 [Condylura cristata]|uniref:interleukin-4 n=1 Tax=Condylura cristata TaxID=143302 RepID=UPI00033430A3|nr:PREDICTED: interleukin-4 [Condylura cristata]
MGLTAQLIPTLVCLLACTSNFVLGNKLDLTLREIIKTLNNLTERKDACMELAIADVFAASKNTTEQETFCRAATELRHFYKHHKCLPKYARGLERNLSGMANMSNCPVKEAKKSTLKDFLERLKMIMKEKYAKY